ncbi:Hypothetical predicted protein [Octopus vulgaris]|uniref:Uncharacterized protein n=1 Tax=Octopus vulgaris TaxID=6645 RepID=A0AA36BZ08_OCTVU|nr:Hypothetical predicted protein [Octopus vulgaris]
MNRVRSWPQGKSCEIRVRVAARNMMEEFNLGVNLASTSEGKDFEEGGGGEEELEEEEEGEKELEEEEGEKELEEEEEEEEGE